MKIVDMLSIISAKKTVEILEKGKWRYGASLPVAILEATLLQYPTGNGVIVTGTLAARVESPNLYYLADAGANTKWIVLPQSRKNTATHHLAIMIPSEMVNCTLN